MFVDSAVKTLVDIIISNLIILNYKDFKSLLERPTFFPNYKHDYITTRTKYYLPNVLCMGP